MWTVPWKWAHVQMWSKREGRATEKIEQDLPKRTDVKQSRPDGVSIDTESGVKGQS